MYRNDMPAYWQGQLAEWGPRVLFALLILVATHFIAKAVQWAIKRLVEKVPALQKDPDMDGSSIGTELGRLGYWLVWLVGLVAALEPLGLSSVLTPVTRMTNEVFSYLPNLIGAVIIFVVGLIVAKVARHIVEAALKALNIEDWATRAGLPLGDKPVAVSAEGEASEGVAPARHSIAKAAGMTVSAIIIVSASIAALQALQIEAISGPATDMLEVIALAIPKVIAAVLWLAIAFVIARWVKSLIETILPSLGFDNAIRSVGVMNEGAQPSRIVGAVAFIAVMLTAAIEAMHSIGGDSVAALLFQVTALGGKVIFGTVIITVGLFLSRLLARIIGEGTGEGGYAQTIVRYSIIALFTAIGLTFMGLANEIVILAFGLILGSAAVATALAFGLGGREAAARTLERWQEEMPGSAAGRAPRPKKLPKAKPADDDSQPPLV
ncbi:mechanosensitive ion channel [Sphingomicrobium aestuariivivum]|uniref:mechanosensitive ion channel n=1 Tax=Sphingomicrobium aestuariivivum TaxID=1582356 RepID=UPI001FD68F80|nr:mechanosensitive ion channel [Sphingomicrobium aestuariivivum]MCJ8191632.1 mechanosensitive ion channel [Sphingomicrobium aestuariivivum]